MAVDMQNTICTCALGHNEVTLTAQPDGTKTFSLRVPSARLALQGGCPHDTSGQPSYDSLKSTVGDQMRQINQLMTSNNSLTQENTNLIQAKSAVELTLQQRTAERDTAISDHANCATTIQDLTSQLTAMTRERNEAVAAHANCAQDASSVNQQVLEAMQARDDAIAAHANCDTTIADLRGQVTTLTDAKTALTEQVSTLTHDKAELAAAHANCDTTIADLTTQVSQLTSERDTLANKNADYTNVISNYTAENETLAQANSDLSAEVERLREELDKPACDGPEQHDEYIHLLESQKDMEALLEGARIYTTGADVELLPLSTMATNLFMSVNATIVAGGEEAVNTSSLDSEQLKSDLLALGTATDTLTLTDIARYLQAIRTQLSSARGVLSKEASIIGVGEENVAHYISKYEEASGSTATGAVVPDDTTSAKLETIDNTVAIIFQRATELETNMRNYHNVIQSMTADNLDTVKADADAGYAGEGGVAKQIEAIKDYAAEPYRKYTS